MECVMLNIEIVGAFSMFPYRAPDCPRTASIEIGFYAEKCRSRV